MDSKRSAGYVALATVLVAAGVGLGSLGAASAGSNSAGLAELIQGVPGTTSVYHLHDSAGHTMDTLKVVRDPTTARYLGVYHWAASAGGFNVGVATSSDLRTWSYQRTLDTAASQPTLAFSPAPKNGPILAVESDTAPHLRFRYWTTVSGMLGASAAYKTFDAAKTLSTCAEGTPEIRSVAYAGSTSTITSGSTIVVSHHYFDNCTTDRQAVGTLSNFSTWTTAPAPTVDAALSAAGADGKHGDRDDFTYQGRTYGIYEGATSPYSPGSWRPYLYDGTTATQLTVQTAAGSTAFANPSATVTVDPAGNPALLLAMFLPSEGAAGGEAGELLYWVPLTSASPSPSASPTSSSSASPSPTASPSPSPTGSPGKVTKVLTFVEENHSLSQMQAGMPYLYGLAKQYAYASNWTAISHPSLPNYLALAGGSTFGVTDDSAPSSHPESGATVFGAAISAGKTAKSYQESMPSNCALSSAGSYAVKHNPWAYFTDERTRCQTGNVPSGTSTSGALHNDIAAGTLPAIGEVTPNLNNDAHDGTLTTADNWLKGWLPQIMAGPDYKAGRLAIVITADEDNGSQGNKVLTTVIFPSLNGAHKVVTTALTHYSWTGLQTQVAGAACVRAGCTASNMAAAFGLPL